MKISSREKTLLVGLLIIALVAAWYYFLLTPQETKLDEMEIEKAFLETQKTEIEMKLNSEPNLDQRIEMLEETMREAAEKFYGELPQEEMLMILDQLKSDVPLTVSSYTFGESELADGAGMKYTANLQYDGAFESLQHLLGNIRTNDKKIIVREIFAQNDFEEALTGNLNLEFNSIPQVEAYSKPYPRLVTPTFIGKNSGISPFAPFDGFDIAEAVENEKTDPDSDSPDYPEYPEDEVIIDYEEYKPRVQIYGFEDGANFFVGNSPDISGYVARSKFKVAGGYSTEVEFDFITAREHSEANVVFDTNPVIISKQAETLGIWVFAYETSNHAIGAVIIDSKGREYKVELAAQVDWTQWEVIEAPMPVEITYPAMVQRIYIEGVGYDQKLMGHYLLDQLQVAYSVN